MPDDYIHGNRRKYLLRCHLIFVCKYRKQLLTDGRIISFVKALSSEISAKHNVQTLYMETDRDHIHYMIETTPDVRLSDYVRVLKQYTTYHLWQNYRTWLADIFWHEHTFWSDGYFVASIGEVSSETLKHYIKNQGK